MREPNEAEIELQILGHLNFKCRHFAIKNHTTGYFDAKLKRFRKHTNPYAANGAPDIYCWLKDRPGIVVGFEVKTKYGEQSTAQMAFELQVKAAGGYYFLVRSIEEVDAALASIR